MRVETLGDGTPEVAIVGGIHGDEPCGVIAIEALLESDLSVERPVKLIVANERALDRDVRYIDEDLNRAFPGSPEADTHEGRLAHELLSEIRGCEILSLHSTQSHPEPFALVEELDGYARSVCPYLSVEALVETAGYSGGRLISYPNVVELECGHQGSRAAAEHAERLSREFLVAVGVLSGDTEPPPPPSTIGVPARSTNPETGGRTVRSLRRELRTDPGRRTLRCGRRRTAGRRVPVLPDPAVCVRLPERLRLRREPGRPARRRATVAIQCRRSDADQPWKPITASRFRARTRRVSGRDPACSGRVAAHRRPP